MNTFRILSIGVLLMLPLCAFSSNKQFTLGDLSFNLDDRWNWEISKSTIKEMQSVTGNSKKLGVDVTVNAIRLEGNQANRTLSSFAKEIDGYFPDHKVQQKSFFTFKNKPAYKRSYTIDKFDKITHQIVLISNKHLYMSLSLK